MEKVNLIELYKSLRDKPLHEQTYGDLSPEEWDAEREKMGMKTDDEGNRYLDREYDPGNEPLEIQMTPDQGEYANKIFYIEPEDIETYVSGGDVEAINPGEREYDEVTANENNSNVTSQGEKEIEKLYGVGVDDVRQAYKDEADPIGFLSNLDLKEQKIPPQGKFEPKKVCCDQNAINYGWSEFTDPNPYSDPCSSYNYWHQYATQNKYGHWQMEDMVIPDLTHWFSTAGAEFMNQGGKVDTFLMQGPNISSDLAVIECDPSVCCGGGQDIKKLKKPLKESIVNRLQKLANIK